jgi:hypothetical protein
VDVEVEVTLGIGDGEGKGVLVGISVAGVHAARMTSARKRVWIFFISLFCHK